MSWLKKYESEEPDYSNVEMKSGGLIKRADGSYSKRGLWDNIRANKGSGKKPTKEMLEQERKIKAKMEYGGLMGGDPTKPYHPVNNPDGYREPVYIAPNDPIGMKNYRAYNDSLSLYNQFKNDKANYERFIKSNNLDPNYIAEWEPVEYYMNNYNTDIHPNIGPIREGRLNDMGGGFGRDASGRARNFSTYRTLSGSTIQILDDSELGKAIAKNYSVYKKPVQPYKLLKREVLTPVSNIEPVGISITNSEPTLIPDNLPKVAYKADEPQASRVHSYSAARELAAMNKPVGYGKDTDGTEVEFSAEEWDKMKGTKYSEFNKPEKKKLGGWLNKYN